MPNPGEYGDAVSIFLTGAAAQDARQPDPLKSFGGYRSSVRVDSFSVSRQNPIVGIRIDHVSGANGSGTGTLLATTANTLTWKAPNGTAGAEIAIANGETKVIPDAHGEKFVVVTRTTASSIGGCETIRLRPLVNNAIGGSNLAPSHYVKYLGVMLVFNENVTNVSILNNGVSLNYEYIYSSYGIETPVDGKLAVISSEDEAPAGVTFVSDSSMALGNLSAGDMRGLWIKRYENAAPGYNGAAAYLQLNMRIRYTLDGTTYTQDLYGVFHVEGHATTSWGGKAMPIPRYETFVGVDEQPFVPQSIGHGVTDIADIMSSSAAFTYAAAAGHTYKFATRYVNRYGIPSAVRKIETITIDEGGGQSLVPPRQPSDIQAVASPDGGVMVRAAYYPMMESVAANKATHWKIYAESDGSNADPATTTPITVAMTTGGDARMLLEKTIALNALEGAPISVLVRTERQNEELGNVESQNTTLVTATAAWYGPDRAIPQAHYLTSYGASIAPPAGPNEITIVDEDKFIYWQMLSGETRLYADSQLVFSMWKDSGVGGVSGMFSVLGIVPYSIEDADEDADDDYDVTEWTSENKVFYLCFGGKRIVKIDLTNGVIGFSEGASPDPIPHTSKSDSPYWRRYEGACIQVWDLYEEDYVTTAFIGIDGKPYIPDGGAGKNSEEECIRG